MTVLPFEDPEEAAVVDAAALLPDAALPDVALLPVLLPHAASETLIAPASTAAAALLNLLILSS